MTGLGGRDFWTAAHVGIGQTVHLSDGDHVVSEAVTDNATHLRHLWFTDGGHIAVRQIATLEVKTL